METGGITTGVTPSAPSNHHPQQHRAPPLCPVNFALGPQSVPQASFEQIFTGLMFQPHSSKGVAVGSSAGEKQRSIAMSPWLPTTSGENLAGSELPMHVFAFLSVK
uniref:Uncharacterized protein n=1 Tax=Mesocestoides corti TaxID=53468 RepID=A0A5K3FBK0_MESCO